MKISKLFLAKIVQAVFIGTMLCSVNLAAMENTDFSNALNEQNEKRWRKICCQNPTRIEISKITGERALDAFLAELHRAEEELKGTYVRLGYFLNRWPSVHLDETPEARRQAMDILLSKGLVEIYTNASDGELAIRCASASNNRENFSVPKESEPKPTPTNFALSSGVGFGDTSRVRLSEANEYWHIYDKNKLYSEVKKNYYTTEDVKAPISNSEEIFLELEDRYQNNDQNKAAESNFADDLTFGYGNIDVPSLRNLPAGLINTKNDSNRLLLLSDSPFLRYPMVYRPYVNPATSSSYPLRFVNFGGGVAFSDNGIHAAPDMRYTKGDCRYQSQWPLDNSDDIDVGTTHQCSSDYLPPNGEWAELRTACAFGEIDKIKSIIETANNPYLIIAQQDRIGDTALHLAIRRNLPEAVGLFLGIAARAGKLKDLLTISNFGIADIPARTPLQLAQAELDRGRGDKSIVELLETMLQVD